MLPWGIFQFVRPLGYRPQPRCNTRESLPPGNELNGAGPDAIELSFLEPGTLVNLVSEPGSYRDILSLRFSEPWFLL